MGPEFAARIGAYVVGWIILAALIGFAIGAAVPWLMWF